MDEEGGEARGCQHLRLHRAGALPRRRRAISRRRRTSNDARARILAFALRRAGLLPTTLHRKPTFVTEQAILFKKLVRPIRVAVFSNEPAKYCGGAAAPPEPLQTLERKGKAQLYFVCRTIPSSTSSGCWPPSLIVIHREFANRKLSDSIVGAAKCLGIPVVFEIDDLADTSPCDQSQPSPLCVAGARFRADPPRGRLRDRLHAAPRRGAGGARAGCGAEDPRPSQLSRSGIVGLRGAEGEGPPDRPARDRMDGHRHPRRRPRHRGAGDRVRCSASIAERWCSAAGATSPNRWHRSRGQRSRAGPSPTFRSTRPISAPAASTWRSRRLTAVSFNHAKSNLKWLEYALLGSRGPSPRSSPTRPRSSTATLGLLVENTTEAWVAALERMIREPELHARVAKSAHAVVSQEYRLDKKADRWDSLYRLVHRERHGRHADPPRRSHRRRPRRGALAPPRRPGEPLLWERARRRRVGRDGGGARLRSQARRALRRRRRPPLGPTQRSRRGAPRWRPSPPTPTTTATPASPSPNTTNPWATRLAAEAALREGTRRADPAGKLGFTLARFLGRHRRAEESRTAWTTAIARCEDPASLVEASNRAGPPRPRAGRAPRAPPRHRALPRRARAGAPPRGAHRESWRSPRAPRTPRGQGSNPNDRRIPTIGVFAEACRFRAGGSSAA